MSTYATVGMILSPSNVMRRLESKQQQSKKKQVRFRSDVHPRLRPSASNLRPLCRLAKKETCFNGSEVFVRALDTWDLDWRQYLHLYYDDEMRLVAPVTESAFREYVSIRDRLVILAEDCKRAYRQWLGSMQAAEQALVEKITDLELQTQLRRLLAARTHVLQRVLFAIESWEAVEERRWHEVSVTNSTRQAMIDAQAAVHETFCDFVDRIDALQRKYKALSDSIRRVQRKAKKLENLPRPASPPSFSHHRGLQMLAV